MVEQPFVNQKCYRLINSRFPPIDTFDDVADSDEFNAVFEIQALTNPRLKNDAGNLNLVPNNERPFGIKGFMYAMAAFTHLPPYGSRFSNGSYGLYYCAKDVKTAIAETRYHQEKYYKNIDGFKYERLVMRTLCTIFSTKLINIIKPLLTHEGWHDKDSYTHSQKLGQKIKKEGLAGIWYGSIRDKYKDCYALFSPKSIEEVIQGQHYEYIWDGSKISDVLTLKKAI